MTTHRRIPSRSLAVLALSAAALTACSSSGQGGFGFGESSAPATQASSTPPSRSTSSSPQTTSSTAAPSTPSSGAPSSAASPASALLLTSEEIGGGFDRVQSDPTDTPLPCTPNAPGPLTQVPPTGSAQIDFTDQAQDISITERVITYARSGDGERVLDAVHRGFGCSSAAAGGSTLRIVGPNDVRSSITANVDQADYWQVRSEAGDLDLIVVRVDSTVVQLAFASAPGASIQIDPNQVLETAVAKAINGG